MTTAATQPSGRRFLPKYVSSSLNRIGWCCEVNLEQALAVDPLAEPLYNRLIPLLLAQGRRADAQRHYQACLKAYQQWKDGGPSDDILRLGRPLAL